MATAHINIGSNTGDRVALIERAVAAIERELKTRALVSSPFESEPWGFESPHRFLNVAVAIDTTMEPTELLRTLLRLQNAIDARPHRCADGSYADRALDIDLIAVDNLVVDTPELQLPHPRMHMREFVLRPMMQTAPAWRHPLSGLTLEQMLDAQD